ncbi:uncharacterized protein TNCV_3144601 [Trichonephila clavipes]|nr:uncharacterized protein TNCV_3144601 [Trichonephila clavipes]
MAKSRSGRSKKRRFTGNRYTIRATINENDETSELNSTESASAKKLESSHSRLGTYRRLCQWIMLTYEPKLAKLCAFLGLPFLSKLAFRNQERKLLKATERVAQENINAALSEIKGSNSFTKCGISIDGTWQRRGYSSLNGCNYYGIAIRNNVGNLQKMMSSVIAAFFHCVSGKNSLHGQCPEGSESWCRYQRAKAAGSPPSKKLSKDFLIKL